MLKAAGNCAEIIIFGCFIMRILFFELLHVKKCAKAT